MPAPRTDPVPVTDEDIAAALGAGTDDAVRLLDRLIAEAGARAAIDRWNTVADAAINRGEPHP